MPEPSDDLTIAVEPSRAPDVLRRFEAAWREAVRGSDPPSIDAFLAGYDGPDRPSLVEELGRIERTYRVRLSFGDAQTIEMEVVRVTAPDASLETCAIAPDPAPAPVATDPGATLGPSQGFDLPDDGFELSEPGASSFELTLPSDPNLATIGMADPPVAPVDGRASVVPPHEQGTVAVGPDGKTLPEAPRKSADHRPTVAGYEIVGELGRGGMGVVYKARQRGLNRLVAIKMVLAGEHAGEDELARFKIEAEAVASIQHPNIVQIYEVGEKDGRPYFSLEYIDGGSLQQKLDGKPLPPRDASAILEPLARAIQNCHERGVIHRDLKPANVLLTHNGTPKITDFGLAKRVEADSKQTRTGTLMGTPAYMAPEQARGDTHEIGPLSDLYSLGAMLYELLTGRPPFQGATLLETLDMVRSREPVPPTTLQPRIPRDLETICLKCLQKEPGRRYADVAGLADDLRRFLDGEPIRARPVGKAERAWRWVRRNPKVAALSGSIVALVLILSATATASAVRSSRERKTIEAARDVTDARIAEVRRAIRDGDFRRAGDLLSVRDEFVERTPALAPLGEGLRKLRAQLANFAEFRRLLDRSRFERLLGREPDPARSRDHCREAVSLLDQIEARSGKAADGMPDFSAAQRQLYREDVFDLLLLAAQAEVDFASRGKDPAKGREANRQAVAWLDRAEAMVPPTKTLHVRRQDYLRALGDTVRLEADRAKAASIPVTSPVDHFWHGIAEQLRSQVAIDRRDQKKALEHMIAAKVEFARLLQARPEHFWGYLEWATCQYRLANRYEAMVGYTTCIQLRPDLPWPYHNRATCHADLKEFEDALADEDRALAIDPDYADARIVRARAYQGLGRLREALSDLGPLIDKNPGRADYRNQRAYALFGAKDYRGALADFDASIALQPLPSTFQDRANAHYKLREFDASIADWAKVAELVPQNAESRYRVGFMRLNQGRFDLAAKALDECLALDPKHLLARLARAQVRRRTGDFEGALKETDAVVNALDASKLDAATKAYYLNDRVDVYRLLGRLDDAENDARRSVALDPKQVDAYVSLARIAKAEDKPAEARAWLDKMLQANPESAGAHLRMAEFLRDLGRWDQALAEADRAETLDPERGRALTSLARAGVLAAKGDRDRARDLAERTLASARPRDGSALLASAAVHGLLARSNSDESADRAAALLKEALTLGSDDLNFQEISRIGDDPAFKLVVDRPEIRALLSGRP